MKALILGFAVIAIAIMVVLPAGLGWWEDVLVFLRGSLPVFAGFVGLILLFTGVSDIKDRAAEKKEESAKKNLEQSKLN